ncbi:MAG: hypothetical protein E7459_10335 [Ruminococcaceae bacterium]|nr:hypothetical protein [Oscillospiraceae bacterium]
MNKEKLMDALGHLEEDLLLETDEVRRKPGRKLLRMRWAAVAACLCLILLGVHYAGLNQPGALSTNEPLQPAISSLPKPSTPEQYTAAGRSDSFAGGEIPGSSPKTYGNNPGLGAIDHDTWDYYFGAAGAGGITIDPMTVDLQQHGGLAADMLAFFIYEGRSYVEYCRVTEKADTLLGNYVATATGLIDEWTEKDGYVELAGSISGDFYTVRGYDSRFILCMKEEDGENMALRLFVNNNGITLSRGSDLYTDRLMLDGDYYCAQYEHHKSWKQGLGQVKTLPETARATVAQFLRALNEGQFSFVRDIPGEDNVLYHLYLHKADGMVVHLRLYSGGYVSFDGIWSVCVQVEQNKFDELMQWLQEG